MQRVVLRTHAAADGAHAGKHTNTRCRSRGRLVVTNRNLRPRGRQARRRWYCWPSVRSPRRTALVPRQCPPWAWCCRRANATARWSCVPVCARACMPLCTPVPGVSTDDSTGTWIMVRQANHKAPARRHSHAGVCVCACVLGARVRMYVQVRTPGRSLLTSSARVRCTSRSRARWHAAPPKARIQTHAAKTATRTTEYTG